MKKRPKATAKSKMFTAGEYIRVVPLHHPKPAVSLDEITRLRGGEEQDLFDGQPHPAPASAHLSYGGGPLIQNVEVLAIFWGRLWGSTTTSVQLMDNLADFFTAILVSPLIDQLAEYNVTGQTVGYGSFIGTKLIKTNAPVGSITDSAIRAQLSKWIKAKTVPKSTKNTVYYAVMPYPTCSGCLGGMPAIDALTETSSHELCEAITDPVPGSGWYDNTNGEIGDICAWNFKKVAGYTVQLEWSNQKGRCA